MNVQVALFFKDLIAALVGTLSVVAQLVKVHVADGVTFQLGTGLEKGKREGEERGHELKALS